MYISKLSLSTFFKNRFHSNLFSCQWKKVKNLVGDGRTLDWEGSASVFPSPSLIRFHTSSSSAGHRIASCLHSGGREEWIGGSHRNDGRALPLSTPHCSFWPTRLFGTSIYLFDITVYSFSNSFLLFLNTLLYILYYLVQY